MRLDLVLPNEGQFMMEALSAGAHFEAMGWDGLWLTDHIVGVGAYARGTKYGALWFDLLIAMGHLVATTKGVRIGSGVLVLPYRDPVIVAKMVTTLDHLSGGRIDLGTGVGWARREFIAVGRGEIFNDRGPFSDEVLDVMLSCWRGGRVAFDGRWFKFDNVDFEPTPVQGDRVPLWIGGSALSPAPRRRAAKYADYWHPSGLTAEEVKTGGDLLDELAGRRVARTARVRCDGDPAGVADVLHRFREAGCVQVACVFDLPTSFGEFDRVTTALYDACSSLKSD